MSSSLRFWLRASLFNLLILSLVGVILRYKIVFSLPFVDQKHLLHGHSHFAFAGWISQVIMTLMIAGISKPGVDKKYQWILFINLLTAYGMLIAFTMEGYGLLSIIFSSCSIFLSYAFAIFYWSDLNKNEKVKKSSADKWFKAAMVFNAFSSIGAFALAIMMVMRINHQNWYLAAEYFYLHFQYNGWFFFACMGLFVYKLQNSISAAKQLNTIFWVYCLACVPAYFLSALWMPIPLIIYGLVVASAFAQLAAWRLFVKLVAKNLAAVQQLFPVNALRLLLLSSIAITIKFLLQLGSTHPALSQLAFGFRPIVIGYLHLVLLGVITIFILGYIVSTNILASGQYFTKGIWLFIAGIIINEALLMLQGVAGLGYSVIPFLNEALFVAAICMASGILLFNLFCGKPISTSIEQET
jgi:hypothetical protein